MIIILLELRHMQVFFAILIGAFSLGQAVPYLGKFVTAVGASSVVYSIIDRVSLILRPRKKEEKGPGTYCSGMHQIPQENLGLRFLALLPRPRGKAQKDGERCFVPFPCGLGTRLSKAKKRNPRFSWGNWCMRVR